MEKFPEISVALSGGGAKCYTQIGVLQGLESAGIRVTAVSATSAACILTCLYAIGLNIDELGSLFSDLKLGRRIFPRPGDRRSLFSLKRMAPLFQELLGDRHFSDLKVPIGFTSVDLKTGELVYLHEGSVFEALMAAVAVPGLFPPQPWRGRDLIDGGVAYSVPVRLARRLAPNRPVLGVALFPPYRKWAQHPLPQLLDSVPGLRWLRGWRVFRAFQIYVRANDITHRLLAEYRLEMDQPEWLVRPPVDHIGLFDPIDLDRATEIGRLAVAEAIESIKSSGIPRPVPGVGPTHAPNTPPNGSDEVARKSGGSYVT
jgi:NTE family protein